MHGLLAQLTLCGTANKAPQQFLVICTSSLQPKMCMQVMLYRQHG